MYLQNSLYILHYPLIHNILSMTIPFPFINTINFIWNASNLRKLVRRRSFVVIVIIQLYLSGNDVTFIIIMIVAYIIGGMLLLQNIQLWSNLIQQKCMERLVYIEDYCYCSSASFCCSSLLDILKFQM